MKYTKIPINESGTVCVSVCNDCGAYANTPEEVVHYDHKKLKYVQCNKIKVRYYAKGSVLWFMVKDVYEALNLEDNSYRYVKGLNVSKRIKDKLGAWYITVEGIGDILKALTLEEKNDGGKK